MADCCAAGHLPGGLRPDQGGAAHGSHLQPEEAARRAAARRLLCQEHRHAHRRPILRPGGLVALPGA